MSSRTASRVFPILLLTLAVVAACRGAQQSGTGTALTATDPMAVCEHLDFPFSDWECPDTNSNLQFMNLADVEEISLVVKTKAGATRVTPLNQRTDAIFLSKRTADTILARYYMSNGDNTKAQGLRGRLSQIP